MRTRLAAAVVALFFVAPVLASPLACLDMEAAGEASAHGCCGGAGLTAGPPECCISAAPLDDAAPAWPARPLPVPPAAGSLDRPARAVVASAPPLVLADAASLHGPPVLALRV